MVKFQKTIVNLTNAVADMMTDDLVIGRVPVGNIILLPVVSAENVMRKILMLGVGNFLKIGNVLIALITILLFEAIAENVVFQENQATQVNQRLSQAIGNKVIGIARHVVTIILPVEELAVSVALLKMVFLIPIVLHSQRIGNLAIGGAQIVVIMYLQVVQFADNVQPVNRQKWREVWVLVLRFGNGAIGNALIVAIISLLPEIFVENVLHLNQRVYQKQKEIPDGKIEDNNQDGVKPLEIGLVVSGALLADKVMNGTTLKVLSIIKNGDEIMKKGIMEIHGHVSGAVIVIHQVVRYAQYVIWRSLLSDLVDDIKG